MRLGALLCAVALLACAEDKPPTVQNANDQESARQTSIAGANTVADLLKTLLGRMADIAAESSEVEDSDVRDQMHDAIYRAFVLQEADYELPREFGMFSPEGNAAVRQALTEFITAARPLAARVALNDPGARLKAFQDIKVRGPNGETYDDYFGDREAP